MKTDPAPPVSDFLGIDASVPVIVPGPEIHPPAANASQVRTQKQAEGNDAMSTDRWNRLSDWHNAWLNGDSAERRRLRDELTSTSPDLVAEADALVAASLSMTGFLETPAFVLTAARLASEEAAMKPGTPVGDDRKH